MCCAEVFYCNCRSLQNVLQKSATVFADEEVGKCGDVPAAMRLKV